jgi:hypothetical protein
MKRPILTVAVGLTSVAALIAVPAAFAAYTSAKLEVRQAGSAATIKASLDPNDDPTASVRIFVPTGTQLTTSQAPGTVLGPVKAIVKALDLAGADLPLEGQLLVAAPGQIAPATQAACLGATAPLASWIMVLSAAGQTLPVPTYLVTTTGAQAALGPAYIQVCLPPPDIPVGTPGRATFGAKLYSAELAINGVFSSVPVGAWVAFWTPYKPGVGQVNVAGTVASPAAIAPGAVTLTAKKSGRGAILTGSVTQAGQARGGATVTIVGGSTKAKLKTVGKAKVAANGKFTLKAKTGTFFRATAIATSGSAAPLCAQLGPALAPIPCVNPTVNGFTAKSKTVKKK